MIVITSMTELPHSCMQCPFQKNKKTPFCRAKRNWYRPFENIPPSFGFYIRDDAFLKGQTPWNARAKWCPLIEVADRKTENCSEKPNNCEICKHWEYDAKYKWWHCPLQDNGIYECHYEPRKLTAVEDEPTISKMEQVDEPKTQMKTQNSNLTFKKRTMRDCYNCKKYETEGECIECHFEPKDEPQTERSE